MSLLDACQNFRYRERAYPLDIVDEFARCAQQFKTDKNDYSVENIEKAKVIFKKFRFHHMDMRLSELLWFFRLLVCRNVAFAPHEYPDAYAKLIERCEKISRPRKQQRYLLKTLRFINLNYRRFPDQANTAALLIVEKFKEFKRSGTVISAVDNYLKFYEQCHCYNPMHFIPYLTEGIKFGSNFQSLVNGLQMIEISLLDDPDSILQYFFEDFLMIVPENFSAKDKCQDIYSFYFRGVHPKSGSRFRSQDGVLVKSVVDVMNKYKMNKSVTTDAINFINEHYGDPRVLSNKYNWSHVDPEVREEFIKFLVRTDITVFFSYIEKDAAHDHVQLRMWKERSAFWQWYLDNNLIDEAWIILTPRILRQYRREFEENGFKSYGVGEIRASNGSYFLFRIGGLVIAECTHNGPTRLYCDPVGSGPVFYRTEKDGHYNLGMIERHNPTVRNHVVGWQGTVDILISDYSSYNIIKMKRGY